MVANRPIRAIVDERLVHNQLAAAVPHVPMHPQHVIRRKQRACRIVRIAYNHRVIRLNRLICCHPPPVCLRPLRIFPERRLLHMHRAAPDAERQVNRRRAARCRQHAAFVHAEIQRQPRTRCPHRAVRIIARLRKRRAHGVHHPRGRSLWSQIRGKVQPIRWLTFPNIAAMPQCRVLLNQQKYRE